MLVCGQEGVGWVGMGVSNWTNGVVTAVDKQSSSLVHGLYHSLASRQSVLG